MWPLLAAVVVVKRVPFLCLCDYLHILHLRMSVWVSLPVEVLGLLVSSADFVVPVGVVSSSLVWRAPSGQ